jgi:hypothetical protein
MILGKWYNKLTTTVAAQIPLLARVDVVIFDGSRRIAIRAMRHGGVPSLPEDLNRSIITSRVLPSLSVIYDIPRLCFNVGHHVQGFSL